MAELYSVVGWKLELVGAEVDIERRRFASKVWKARPGYSLLLIVKYKWEKKKGKTIK